jgi:hypothetical protein
MDAKPKLLPRVRIAIRTRHYSRRTEEAYVMWIKRFIIFHNKKHPSTMGPEEVNAFLSHLATDRNVAAATQNQALGALLPLSPCSRRALAMAEGCHPCRTPRAPAGCLDGG